MKMNEIGSGGESGSFQGGEKRMGAVLSTWVVPSLLGKIVLGLLLMSLNLRESSAQAPASDPFFSLPPCQMGGAGGPGNVPNHVREILLNDPSITTRLAGGSFASSGRGIVFRAAGFRWVAQSSARPRSARAQAGDQGLMQRGFRQGCYIAISYGDSMSDSCVDRLERFNQARCHGANSTLSSLLQRQREGQAASAPAGRVVRPYR